MLIRIRAGFGSVIGSAPGSAHRIRTRTGGVSPLPRSNHPSSATVTVTMIAALHILSLSAAALLAIAFHFLRAPSLLLYALHTYIHPDSLPPDAPRAALRPPGAVASKRRPPDSSFQQLYRLRLSYSHLTSRTRFRHFHLLVLLFASSLTHFFVSWHNSATVTFSLCIASAVFAAYTVAGIVFDQSFSRRSERLVSIVAATVGGVFGLLCGVGVGGVISGVIFVPALCFARVFWLGTDQPRSELAVLSASLLSRTILYLSVILSVMASVLPVGLIMPFAVNRNFKIAALEIAAVAQMLALRTGVQMYLNEAVYSWYQRLHASRVPDLDYGRAKVFLHNHHICTVSSMLFAVPAMVIFLLSVSQLRGSLFEFLPFTGSEGLSNDIKEMALSTAWWIVLSWSVFTIAILTCYRSRLLIVS